MLKKYNESWTYSFWIQSLSTFDLKIWPVSSKRLPTTDKWTWGRIHWIVPDRGIKKKRTRSWDNHNKWEFTVQGGRSELVSFVSKTKLHSYKYRLTHEQNNVHWVWFVRFIISIYWYLIFTVLKMFNVLL